MKILIYIFILLASVRFGYAQPSDSAGQGNDKSLLYEKLYLHIDRELYTPGDVVWFKSYLVSGINHKLITGYKNIYVQLVAEDGKLVDQKLLLSKNGSANGDFLLSDSIPDGNYIVRAYTKYLQNFGTESYFHKKIVVAGARSSLELNENLDDMKPSGVDVAFLPESGNFVLNAVNHVAFKAIDKTGRGIAVTGKIVDETGSEIVAFRSSYRGMGRLIMMPQEGKHYYARIDGFPDYDYKFDQAREQGISLNYKPDGPYLVFTLTRNLKIYHSQEFLLVASHKGTELFSSQITMNEFQQAVRLYKGLFPLGISQITVYNRDGEKMAERLVFIRNANDRKVQMELNRKEYKSREKVEIDLLSLLPENDTILSTVSVSVVNEDYFSASGNNLDIESYLLLDSELKGPVESPASFFIDEPEITSDEKLDLVMMVNGWRSYYWNEIDQFAGVKLPGWADYGLTLDGKVFRMWGRKPVEYGKVVLGPFSRNFLFEETTTDQDGKFSFDKLYLKDSALIMINAETKNSSKLTRVVMEQRLGFDSLVSAEQLKLVSPGIMVPMRFYREIYYRQQADQEYEKELGTVLLGQINIEGKKAPRIEDNFRLYGEPDHSFSITRSDMTFANIADYLETKVPGLVVSGSEIRIRAGDGNPLLLVDGLEADWDYIIHLPLGDVDKIEILKNSALMAVYGSRGGNGIIAIITKTGSGIFEEDFVRNVPGRITPNVMGFQQPRQFYSPKYSLNNINDPRPDFRPTLFWDPDVLFSGMEAKIEFFTSDKLARYYVQIEGISKNGKIICNSGILTVSVPR